MTDATEEEGNNLWDRLRRRKVVQWGIAYAALREADRAGWRGPYWRYHRDFDPCLASIRNTPGFKAVFADIERDMARQRAELAARPKDAPISLAAFPRRP